MASPERMAAAPAAARVTPYGLGPVAGSCVITVEGGDEGGCCPAEVGGGVGADVLPPPGGGVDEGGTEVVESVGHSVSLAQFPGGMLGNGASVEVVDGIVDDVGMLLGDGMDEVDEVLSEGGIVVFDPIVVGVVDVEDAGVVVDVVELDDVGAPVVVVVVVQPAGRVYGGTPRSDGQVALTLATLAGMAVERSGATVASTEPSLP